MKGREDSLSVFMEHALEIIGTLVGLLYLWLEYRASIYLWIAGIIMPAVYIFVYYDAGLYADFGINIYYLGAAIYGWMMWKYGTFLRRKILRQKAPVQQVEDRRTEGQKELPITRMPVRYLLPLTVIFAAALLGIAWILVNFTDSNVPWLDSFTTAMSIIGMWMLARKYVEQWWVEKPCDFDPFGQTGLSPFGYNMIDPLKSWCWGSILFYPFKISRFS